MSRMKGIRDYYWQANKKKLNMGEGMEKGGKTTKVNSAKDKKQKHGMQSSPCKDMEGHNRTQVTQVNGCVNHCDAKAHGWMSVLCNRWCALAGSVEHRKILWMLNLRNTSEYPKSPKGRMLAEHIWAYLSMQNGEFSSLLLHLLPPFGFILSLSTMDGNSLLLRGKSE